VCLLTSPHLTQPPPSLSAQKSPEDGASTKDLYFAATVLEHAGKAGSKPSGGCKYLNKVIAAKGSKVAKLSFAIRAAASLGCLEEVRS
jgi:hypothetical protein